MDQAPLPMQEIIAFEQGRLSEEDTAKLFQRLIDDGSIWRLQGMYGRIAQEFLNSGVCQPPAVRPGDSCNGPDR